MPRRSAFSFEILDIHLQPSMRRAFSLADMAPTIFELSLLDRLEALRRIFDDKADRGQVAAAA